MKPIYILCLCWATSLSAQNTPLLGLSLDHVNKFEKVYNLYAKDYDDMLVLQYSLAFNQAEMTFREVRPGVLNSYVENNFGNPFPGVITSVWYDPSLNGQNNPDSSVLIQFVFDIVQAGGSTLCFADTPLDYEFYVEENQEPAVLSQIQLQDECFTGLVLLDNSTGISGPQVNYDKLLNQVALNTQGELMFESSSDKALQFRLLDVAGKELAATNERQVLKGTNSIQLGKQIISGIYFLQVMADQAEIASIKLYVK